MGDFPVKFTFDNLASVALQELEKPVLLQIEQLESELKAIEEDYHTKQSTLDKCLEQKLRSDNIDLFNALSPFCNVNLLDRYEEFVGSDRALEFEFDACKDKVSGSISFVLSLSRKDIIKFQEYKDFKKAEKKRKGIENKLEALNDELYNYRKSAKSVKNKIMSSILESSDEHIEFKKFIKNKIKSSVNAE